MIEIIVLDRDLNRIGVIDYYESVIWAKRYNDIGDCELYLPATTEALSLLKKGNYLTRDDDDMVCRIETIEIDTDVETGNYLIVTGYDAKKILHQRIIWSQLNVDGSVEGYIRSMVQKSLCNPALEARQIRNSQGQQMFFLGNVAGFTEVTTEQVTYDVVGEKVRDLCLKYGWGHKIVQDAGKFYFVLYKGTDRKDSVVFSEEYENLKSTKFSDDETNLANVALIAGEGEGSERMRNVSGYAEGINRFEIYVDARDLSRTIDWESLTSMYPTTDHGGHGYIVETAGGVFYKMDLINIEILDADQLTQLEINYPNGQVVTIGGVNYYQIYDVIIADLESSSPEPTDSVILRPLIYEVYLLNRGYENMSEYGGIITFEGTIEPDVTFVYKVDYDLGDIVTVQNQYGISVDARIVEIVENEDSNGYKVEPKFEYQNEGSTVDIPYLITENGKLIASENGDYLSA